MNPQKCFLKIFMFSLNKGCVIPFNLFFFPPTGLFSCVEVKLVSCEAVVYVITVLLDSSVVVSWLSLTTFLLTVPYCYAVHVGVWLLTFRDGLLVPSGRVKQSKKTPSPLKMGLIACCGMLINNYQHILC